MISRYRLRTFLLTSLFSCFLVAPPALSQNAFALGEAGKGRTCYFGECSDSPFNLEPPPSPPKLQPRPQPPPQPPPQPQLEANNYADELTNFGVQAQSYLQSQLGTETPRSIPGGRVVTTEQLRAALSAGRRSFLLIDALGDAHQETIESAGHIPDAGRSGNFNDLIQQRLFSTLNQWTNRNVAYPLVFFCQGSRCWESYNAALRAINMGFSNVYWYRGGISAWKEAGLPMMAVNW